MKAYNIDWLVDLDEVYEILDDMSFEKAALAIGVPPIIWANMTTEERHDKAYSLFHHCPATLDEFLNLPNEVEIPDELIDENDITDYLCDTFGYCIGKNGYSLSIDIKK